VYCAVQCPDVLARKKGQEPFCSQAKADSHPKRNKAGIKQDIPVRAP